MPEGKLQVSVFRETVGAPQGDAVVQVLDENTNNVVEELITDASGKTLLANLPAPPVEESLDSQNTQRPYAVYNLRVQGAGTSENMVTGVQVLADSIAEQNVFLIQQTDLVEEIYIPYHTLYGEFPPKIPEDEVKPLPPATGEVVLSRPVIPEYIVVHDGVPTNTGAPNYYVPFKDYINNVASCEIYATWPTDTIKANVLAIMSFTLNRVYTEWYRSRGYNFTITSSTAYDQAFSYGRNFFSEIADVVDEVFTNYITRPDIRQPLFTQYCDGQRVTCPTWLSQWGSKYLADQGYDYMQILRNFYGSEIFLNQAAQVAGIPASYGGELLTVGSVGADVRTIQEQLNAISNNYPLIPKIAVDGVFGDATAEAVSVFQGIFNLPRNGIVDYSTWYEISRIYVAVMQLA